MNIQIVPTNTRMKAKPPVSQNLEQWRNFAQRITKNPFVKTYLIERDGTICGWCKKELYDLKIVHHISYDHYCSYDKVIRINSPTPTNPFKTRLVPDCKSCMEDTLERFETCMQKLVLVHSICNKHISDQLQSSGNSNL